MSLTAATNLLIAHYQLAILFASIAPFYWTLVQQKQAGFSDIDPANTG
jgi:hypothetical protein